ncbi:DNA topology modulation protein FlaR [Niallia sp. 03133]|uniref:DNA topology modulation protein FlaR n=1 Tax=Niallia sp. 03133 TaxID=3458060 RepID=UPI004044535E
MVWKRHPSGDIRRTEEEMEKYLNTIIYADTWIIEGIHNQDWVSNSFYQAELIVFLDTKYSVRIYRIIKRFVLQKLGLEKSNYKPTIPIFLKMFIWNKKIGKQNFFEKYGKFENKIVIVKNKREIKRLFDCFLRTYLTRGKEYANITNL